MESTSDNDHQHRKQWPINIPWQVVKCEKSKVGVGRGLEGPYASMSVCVYMCESVRRRQAVTGGETVLQSSREMARKISPWGWCGGPAHYLWKQMSPVGRSSDTARLILRVLPLLSLHLPLSLPFYDEYFICFYFIRSLGPVRARGSWGRKIYIHTSSCFLNKNSHSLQKTSAPD